MGVITVRLPILRAERGLSQRQLAVLAGVRPDTISALERGASEGIRFDTLARLCDALGCEPGDIFELAPEFHAVPLLGGPYEDDILLARVRESVEERAHRPASAPTPTGGRAPLDRTRTEPGEGGASKPPVGDESIAEDVAVGATTPRR